MNCQHIHEPACCEHTRSQHWKERVLMGDPDDAFRECQGCAVPWARVVFKAVRKGDKSGGQTDHLTDPEHAYKPAVKCGKPEHAPFYPAEPHERVYGHPFVATAEKVGAR